MQTQTIKISLTLRVEKDADVIEYLEAQENATDTIRQALRAQMLLTNRSGA